MKKTVTINLNGRKFTIDEDAYQLLDSYLQNLQIHFGKDDSASEIIADFEARIEELLNEKLRLEHEVISISQIEEVIARMGKPTDFAETGEAKESRQTTAPEQQDVPKKLFRNVQEKGIAGICSGIAAYYGWNTIWVRLVFIALLFLTHGIWLIAYLIAWLVIPGANTAEQKLQMQGKPVTVENIGKVVSLQTAPQATTNKGCFGAVFGVFAGIGCLIALPIILLIVAMIVILPHLFNGGLPGVFAPEGVAEKSFLYNLPILSEITLFLLIGIPVAALIYWIIAQVYKLNPLNKIIKATGLAIWLIAVVFFFFAPGKYGDNSFFRFPFVRWEWKISENVTESSHPSGWISGDGAFFEKEDVIDEPIEAIRLLPNLKVNLQIEQTSSGKTTILFSGDENLVKNVSYKIEDKKLRLNAEHSIYHNNNLIIHIKTPILKQLEVYSSGSVFFPRAFTADDFELVLKSVSKFKIDSLTVNSLDISANDVGTIEIAGKVHNAHLKLNGLGSLDTRELVADSVYAHVDGDGAIRCYPVKYLNAKMEGAGSITYFNDPPEKVTAITGSGEINKE